MPLLRVNDLKTYFDTEAGLVKAVDGVSFTLEPEQTLGLVGESGCGKSLTALSILGLIQPPGRVVSGEIWFQCKDRRILDLSSLNSNGKEIRMIRGGEIAMIFQEPMTSLDPVFTIGSQIVEILVLHQEMSKKAARRRAIEMLKEVGIPLPEQRFDEYPHQLSGGMRQRAMIAMALACRPSLLICDEPTTALDVTIQAQVLDLMVGLRNEFRTSIIMITHDLGVIAEMADHVIVMYVGSGVEYAGVKEIFHNPLHPYTQGLMASIPSISAPTKELEPIKGVVPDPINLPKGCRFEPRCPRAMAHCRIELPYLKEIRPGHQVACWLYE
ncbi:MAG: ABC transporter ATP-binding protein [Desulfobacterales bacterium]|nr:MAG: ABC transporter ATP-binding protein [Desulfobacterales bacterium]